MEIHKKYSFVKEHDKSYELHDSTDKKRFHVLKKDLHPARQLQMLKMQKFYDGGMAKAVDSDDSVDDSADSVGEAAEPVPVEEPSVPDLGFVPQMQQSIPTPAPEWHAPMLPQGPAQPMASAEMPQSVQASGQQQQSQFAGVPGFGEAEKGMRMQAAGAQELGQAQQTALADYQKNMDRVYQDHQMNTAKLDKEQEELQKKYMSGEINPKRYYDKMSTGQRVGTAIALMLGGIGAGITGGPSVAVQMLNKAVDDDISAQHAELGKKQNLLSLNMHKYGNMQAAEAATRLQYNTAMQTQLQSALAKANSTQAAAGLHMQLGKLQQDAMNYKSALAGQMGKLQSLGYGGGEGGIPEGAEPPQLLLDPKYRENRVVINGRAYQATEKTEAEKLRRTESIAGPVIQQIGELRDLAKDASTKVPGAESNMKAHSIINNLAVQMPQLSGLTRINEVEIEHLLKTFHDPTKMGQAFGDVKSANILKTIADDLESKRSSVLIGYKGAAGLSGTLRRHAGGPLPRNK